MLFTTEQNSIINYFNIYNTENKSLFVNSCAGSGKTTTMIEAVNNYCNSNESGKVVRIISLTNRVTLDINRKIGFGAVINGSSVTVSTFHRFMRELYCRLFDTDFNELWGIDEYEYFIGTKCRGLYRSGTGSDRGFKEFIYKYNMRKFFGDRIQYDTYLHSYVEIEIENAIRNMSAKKMCFNDMLKLIIDECDIDYKFYNKVREKSVDLLCIDEVQDLSEIELFVISKLFYNNDVKCLLIGDIRQSIFGFKNDYGNIIQDYLIYNDCINMDTSNELTYNFRCNSSHITFIGNLFDYTDKSNMVNFNKCNNEKVQLVLHRNDSDMYKYINDTICDNNNDDVSYAVLCRNNKTITDYIRSNIGTFREVEETKKKIDFKSLSNNLCLFLRVYYIHNRNKYYNYLFSNTKEYIHIMQKLLGNGIGYSFIEKYIVNTVYNNNINKTPNEHFLDIKNGYYLEFPKKIREFVSLYIDGGLLLFNDTQPVFSSVREEYEYILVNVFGQCMDLTGLSLKTLNPVVAYSKSIMNKYKNEILDSIMEIFPTVECLFENNDIQGALKELLKEKHYKTHSNIIGKDMTVSTIHSAKGMEYDEVHIIVPNEPKHKENKLLQEEIRIYYVAITRARNKLYIHYKYSERNKTFINTIKRLGGGHYETKSN